MPERTWIQRQLAGAFGPRPFTFTDPRFLSLKAGAATFLALVLSDWLGNPDLVSASFVAVLSCSPSVMMGLRLVRAQFFGSVLGGVFGALMGVLGVEPLYGVPIAVTASVWGAFRLGFPGGMAVAAFTALFVQLVHFGPPTETVQMRLLAIGLAGLSGMLVNLVVSSLFYDRVFGKRLAKLEQHITEKVHAVATEGTAPLLASSCLVAELDGHLRAAAAELEWRRDRWTLAPIQRMQARLAHWERFLHYAKNLHLEAEAIGQRDTVGALLTWVCAADGAAPEVDPTLKAPLSRLVEIRAALAADPVRDTVRAWRRG